MAPLNYALEGEVCRLVVEAVTDHSSGPGRAVGLSVCLLVCHDRELCRNGCTDREAVRDIDSVGPREPRIR